MAPEWRREEDEEEEEEELDETNYISQKDAVLFAIEVSESMLAAPPASDDKKAEKDSPTIAAIKCAYQIMQQRIISNPKDMMGVLLFGTALSKFQEEDGTRSNVAYPHCYLLSDLNIPGAEDVKALRAIVNGDEETKDLLEPSDEPVSMSNLLFCANQIFTTRAPNFGSRRLFIISDQDDPHSKDKNARSQATVRAKDLYDLGVVIELFPISHPDHEFNREKFYDDIIYCDPSQEESQSVTHSSFKAASNDGITLLNSLIADINSKQTAKRALFSDMPFEIGPGLTVSVKGYNMLQKQAPARTCFVYAAGEKAQLVVGETAKMSEALASTVEKTEIKKAYKFGGTQIPFTPAEQKELKNFGPPGLRIIGFKPQSMLPIWHAVKKSTFIFPSDEGYVGSTRVFAALWQKLLKDKKMGIAWFIARKNATPLLVAILPSQERIDPDTNSQSVPAGLWLYPLPFADDIRDATEILKPVKLASEVLVDDMQKVVRQLQLPKGIYDPSKYPNPSLQWFYQVLQASALEEEAPEQSDFKDKTVPKYRQINRVAGEYLNAWGVTLEDQWRALQSANKTIEGTQKNIKKRGSEDPDDAPKKKKVKTESGSLKSMSVEEVRKLVESDTLKSTTVAELKEFLVSKGLSSSGKKSDLLERVEQWVEDH